MAPDPHPSTVSVVIPCFDSARFLREAVASVVSQTHRARELVLVDDGSTDGTRALAAELIVDHPDERMTLLSQDNAGVAAARNLGIATARGRYILPLDADDRIAPTMLEECVRVLDADPHTSIVFTDRLDFGELDGVYSAGRFELGRLKYFDQIAYCSMFRREVWQTVGGYRTNVSGFDDWDFWIAAAARGFTGHHLPRPLFHHRRHRGSQLCAIVDDYERFHATIVLNNRNVYSDEEVAAAERFLRTGEPSTMLSMSRLIFSHRYPMPDAPSASAPG